MTNSYRFTVWVKGDSAADAKNSLLGGYAVFEDWDYDAENNDGEELE